MFWTKVMRDSRVAFRSAKVALLSRSERRLCRQLIPLQELCPCQTIRVTLYGGT